MQVFTLVMQLWSFTIHTKYGRHGSAEGHSRKSSLCLSDLRSFQYANYQSIFEGETQLKVIECNLRASRSFPFVSKVLGHNFIETATAAIVGQDIPESVDIMNEDRGYTAIKVAQFSWTRLGGADPFLGVGEYPATLFSIWPVLSVM